eukprot:Nk52_evm8s225 gene=Nk52_evmTU8s225
MSLLKASGLNAVFATAAIILLIVTISASASPLERRAEGADFAPKYINVSYYDTMDGPVTGMVSNLNVCDDTSVEEGWAFTLVSGDELYLCAFATKDDCEAQMKKPEKSARCKPHGLYNTPVNKKTADPFFPQNQPDTHILMNYTRVNTTHMQFMSYALTDKCQTKGAGVPLPTMQLAPEMCNSLGGFFHYDKETKMASLTSYHQEDCTGDYLSYTAFLINTCMQTMTLFITGMAPYQQITVSSPAQV